MKEKKKGFGLVLILILGVCILVIEQIGTAESSGIEPFVLNQENRDFQGIAYTLDDDDKTAMVGIEDGGYENTSGYEGYGNGNVTIPKTVEKNGNQYTVTKMAPHVFAKSKIKTLTLSNTVENISYFAFNGSSLTSIRIGRGVKEVDEEAFPWCDSIEEIYVDPNNPYYTCEDGVLFDLVKKTLLRFPPKNKSYKGSVYSVPDSVKRIGNFAFCRTNVFEVKFPESVKEIGMYAFNQSKVTHIDIKNVTEIERDAFSSCNNLNSFRLGNESNTVWFEEGAFASSMLKSVFIPNSVVFEENAISGCHSLKFAIMENGGQLATNMFYNCDTLKYLILPDDLEYIPSNAIKECRSLEKLYIPPTVKMIGSGALEGCDITIYGVKGSVAQAVAAEMGLAFVDTSNHEHILENTTFYFDEHMEITGKYCEECGYGTECEITAYSDAEVGQGVTPMPKPTANTTMPPASDTFLLDKDNKDYQGIVYTLIDVDGTAKVGDADDSNNRNTSGYRGYNEGNVTIPAKVEKDGKTYTVTEMVPYVFSFSRIKSLTISDNLKNISHYAFYNSTIASISIGRNVERISEYAFHYNKNLKEIHVDVNNPYFKSKEGVLLNSNQEELICFPPRKLDKKHTYTVPNSVKRISAYAFAYTNIYRVNLSDSVERIGEFAFYYSKVMSMDFNNVKEIGSMSFAWNGNLQWIKMGNTMEIVSNRAFYGCSSLEAIYMPVKGLQLSEEEFSFCSSLKRVVLPDALTDIPNKAFEWCVSLKKIYIPPSVKFIGEGVLEGCDTIVYGEAGSTAETFANKKGFQFVDVANHMHNFSERTLYYKNSIKITGNDCEVCGYGSEYGLTLLPDSHFYEVVTKEPNINTSTSTPPAPTPTISPTVTPTIKPTTTPIMEPTKTPSVKPAATPSMRPTAMPNMKPTVAPPSQNPTKVVHSPNVEKVDMRLKVSGFKVFSGDNKYVTLKWEKNNYANAYELYRSNKKGKEYELIKKVNKKHITFIDKKVTPKRRYYYKIRAIRNIGSYIRKGSYTTVKCIKPSGLVAPVISVKKGVTVSGAKYLMVRLKKYTGKYVEIYFKTNRKKYKKVILVSNLISKNKVEFQIRYMTDYSSLHIKIRTYEIKKKKKAYSKFSRPVHLELGGWVK